MANTHDLLVPIGSQSASFLSQEAIGVQSTPFVKPLILTDRWIVNTYADWNSFGTKNIYADIATVPNSIGVQLGNISIGETIQLWSSEEFQSNFFGIPRVVWNDSTLGSYSISVEVTSSPTSRSGYLAWVPIWSNGTFPNTDYQQGWFHQVRIKITRLAGAEVSPFISYLRLENWWNPHRDPLQFTHIDYIGDISREIERDFTAITTQSASLTMSNELGFWNEKGFVQNTVNSPVVSMERLTSDTPAKAGLYRLVFNSGTSVTVKTQYLDGSTATNTVTVTCDGVTQNTNVITGQRLIFASGTAEYDSANIMLGIFFAFYNPAPIINTFSANVTPGSGSTAGGTSVLIYGSGGFTGATSATLNGVPLTSFVVVSDTEITGVTPANPAGSYSLIVNSPGVQTFTNAFVYQTVTVPNPSLYTGTFYSPYNQPIKIYHGFEYVTGGNEIFEGVPAFTGYLNNVQVSSDGAKATLACADPVKQMLHQSLEHLTIDGSDGTYTNMWFKGDSMVTMIQRMLAYCNFDPNPPDGTQPFNNISAPILNTPDNQPAYSDIGKPASIDLTRCIAFNSSTGIYYAGINNQVWQSKDKTHWTVGVPLATGDYAISFFMHPTNGLLYIMCGTDSVTISNIKVWNMIQGNPYSQTTALSNNCWYVRNNQIYDSTNNAFYLVCSNDTNARMIRVNCNGSGVASTAFTPNLSIMTSGMVCPGPYQFNAENSIVFSVDTTNRQIHYVLMIVPSGIKGLFGCNFNMDSGGTQLWGGTQLGGVIYYDAYHRNGIELTYSATWDSTNGFIVVTNIAIYRCTPLTGGIVGKIFMGYPQSLSSHQYSWFDNTNSVVFTRPDGTILQSSGFWSCDYFGLQSSSQQIVPVNGDAGWSSNLLYVPAYSSFTNTWLGISAPSNVLWQYSKQIYLISSNDSVNLYANFGSDYGDSVMKDFAEASCMIFYFDEDGKFWFSYRPSTITPVDYNFPEDEIVKITEINGDNTSYPIINQANVTPSPQNALTQTYMDSSTTTQVIQYNRQAVTTQNQWVYSNVFALALATFQVQSFDKPHSQATTVVKFHPSVTMLQKITMNKGRLGLYPDTVYSVHKSSFKYKPYQTEYMFRKIIQTQGNL